MKGWQRLMRRRNQVNWFAAIAIGATCVFVAFVVRLLLGQFGQTLSFATFYPAAMVAALVGGTATGLLSILLSIVVVWWAFIDTPFAFGPLTKGMLLDSTVFSISALAVVALAILNRRLVFDLEDSENERTLLSQEIQHRHQNLLAVTASLVSQTIEDKQAGQTLIARVHAAADASDLLTKADMGNMSLQELLASSVKQHFDEQVTLDGPDIKLDGNQCHSLRIVFHELTTNALKYGALSEIKGRLNITWDAEMDAVVIRWCEFDGPKVAAPSKHNFGSKLIDAMLRKIGAQLSPTFAETGYCYKISVPHSVR